MFTYRGEDEKLFAFLWFIFAKFNEMLKLKFNNLKTTLKLLLYPASAFFFCI